MSGNQGGGAAIGTGIGFAAGGPVGAVVGGALGAAIGGYQDDKRAQKRLQNDLIQPVKPTTPLPTPNDAAVQQARNDKLIALQSQSGRASTWLSGTQGTKTTFG